ncbi:MAG: uncharacterized protein QOJ07_2334 [Thermoleophilaceae bacterium]|nr:uncharacterized protein [Thermoleophilaceae bacterium]
MADPPDVAALAVALGRALGAAGLPASPERSARFARALGLARPRGRDEVYWIARAVWVSARDQIPVFDRVFAALAGSPPPPERGDPNAPPLDQAERRRGSGSETPRIAPAPAPGAGMRLTSGGTPRSADEPEEDDTDPATLAAWSPDERLGRKNFAALDEDELHELRRLMRRLAVAPPERRTRRHRRSAHGRRLDLRATLRASLRTGGDPVRLARRRRRVKRRSVVLLLDVSGSMEPYARAFLQFLESAAGGAHAETFAFATRLTRITRALREGNPQDALDRAAAAAPDWAGGTRLGDALADFNRVHGRRGMARGAVVVILSDGWERGDPALVAREMERLGRLAHRIVWVNPRAAAPGWEPLAGGMAAALPHCDTVLSGHSLEALDAVVAAIGGAADVGGEKPWNSRTSST